MKSCPSCGRRIEGSFCPVCFCSLQHKKRLQNRRLLLRLLWKGAAACGAAVLVFLILPGGQPALPVQVDTGMSTAPRPSEPETTFTSTAMGASAASFTTFASTVAAATTGTTTSFRETTAYPSVAITPEEEVQRVLKEKLGGDFRQTNSPYGLLEYWADIPLGYTAEEIANEIISHLYYNEEVARLRLNGQPPFYYVKANDYKYGEQKYDIGLGYPPASCEPKPFGDTLLDMVEQALPGGNRLEEPPTWTKEKIFDKYWTAGYQHFSVPSGLTVEQQQQAFVSTVASCILANANPSQDHYDWTGWYMGTDEQGDHHFTFWYGHEK